MNDPSNPLMSHIEGLWHEGYTPHPLCRPTSADGHCTANWHRFPCKDAGKRPLSEGYSQFVDQPPNLEQVFRLFNRRDNPNIGIILPKGIRAVDADSVEAEVEVIEAASGALQTPTRAAREGRGCVRLYQDPFPSSPRSTTRAGVSKKIDFLGPGANLVVPPSMHQTGHWYSWLPGLAPGQVPTLPMPVDLQRILAERLNKAPDGLLLALNGVPDSVREPRRTTMQLIEARGPLRRLFLGEGKSHGDTSSSGYDASLAFALLKERLSIDEVVAVLAARPGKHNSEAKYLYRTVQRIAAYLARQR